ncbi:unnamed protein product [Rotaria magnacalcarata]
MSIEDTILSIDNQLSTSFNEIADIEVENFFGCYLLNSLNPACKGRTYIGFTVDPHRRIKQHNKGKDFGGAKKTSGKGPWEMVLIVHGFPNEITALRFEWAWQNPEQFIRLKHLNLSKNKRKCTLQFKLKILAEMLCIGPWARLPLTVRWLSDKKQVLERMPPLHMPITSGPINVSKQTNTIPSKRKKTSKQTLPINDDSRCFSSCSLCNNIIQPPMHVSCPKCSISFHIICLSKYFLKNTEEHYIIPIDGSCPSCKKSLLWGEIIQNKYTNRSCSLPTVTHSNESDDDDDVIQ